MTSEEEQTVTCEWVPLPTDTDIQVITSPGSVHFLVLSDTSDGSAHEAPPVGCGEEGGEAGNHLFFDHEAIAVDVVSPVWWG